MKSITQFLSFSILLSGLMLFISCSEDEDPGPVIINQAPTGSINDQGFNPGFGSATLDLSTFISDQEGDPITYSAVSSDVNVVTVSVNSDQLIITEVGLGTSTITVTASDGNAGNETQITFIVLVEPISGAPDITAEYIIDFNGYDNGPIVEGTIEGFGVEGLDEFEEPTDAFGSATIENNDHMLFIYNSEEVAGVEMGWFLVEEGEGLDFTGKKIRFDFAYFSGNLVPADPDDEEAPAVDIELFFADPSFEENFAGVVFSTLFPNGVPNSSEWMTLEIPLEDFVTPDWFDGGDADPSNIGSFFFAMYGATEDNPITFRMDNFAVVD